MTYDVGMSQPAPEEATPVTELGEEYPPFVRSENERKRWDMCAAIARQTWEGDDDAPAQIWQMTRSLYQSEIPT